MACLLLILISLLGLVSHSEGKLEVLNNVYIVESNWPNSAAPPEKLTLACSTSEEQHPSVYWMKDQKWKGNGMNLEISVKEPLDAGNYTCRSNATHDILSYSTVYIQKINDKGEIAEPILIGFKDNGLYFKCTANNYSGHFQCFWTPHIRISPLQFKIKVTSENAVCDEPVKNSMGEGYSTSCKKGNLCPSTEEYEQTGIVLEVFHGFVYERHIHYFFIKDILKPDIPECQIDNSNVVTWTPPKTWSTPVTYYGLTYQIKTVQHDSKDKICEVDNSVLLQNGNTLRCYKRECKYKHCFIRARDRYNKNSSWSNWSPPCRKFPKNDKPHIKEEKTKIEPCKCQKN
ncbi:interleukin-12 subunit beta-like isoform X2 [Rhineura floridana]|uniref:interleukin-12 subunit beta-like isoform X2 n=1 Tax=Rhineura floridana TaxID=261503 RepID=UPI002AC8304A|nr:interleukin-12 subunit beta-like isoform X2 [Rhineura floridana]